MKNLIGIKRLYFSCVFPTDCPSKVGYNKSHPVVTIGVTRQVQLLVDQAFQCDTSITQWKVRIGRQTQFGPGYGSLDIWRPLDGGKAYKLVHRTPMTTNVRNYYVHRVILEKPIYVKRCDVIGYTMTKPGSQVSLQGMVPGLSTYVNNPSAFPNPMYHVYYTDAVNTTTLKLGSVLEKDLLKRLKASIYIQAFVKSPSKFLERQCILNTNKCNIMQGVTNVKNVRKVKNNSY